MTATASATISATHMHCVCYINDGDRQLHRITFSSCFHLSFPPFLLQLYSVSSLSSSFNCSIGFPKDQQKMKIKKGRKKRKLKRKKEKTHTPKIGCSSVFVLFLRFILHFLSIFHFYLCVLVAFFPPYILNPICYLLYDEKASAQVFNG